MKKEQVTLIVMVLNDKPQIFFQFWLFFFIVHHFSWLVWLWCTHKLLNQNSISYKNVIKVKSICHTLSKFENSSLLFHHDSCKTYDNIIGGGWLIIYGCSLIKWPWRPFIYIILCHFASNKPKYSCSYKTNISQHFFGKYSFTLFWLFEPKGSGREVIIFEDTTFDVPIGNCIDLECGMGMWKNACWFHLQQGWWIQILFCYLATKSNVFSFIYIIFLVKLNKI